MKFLTIQSARTMLRALSTMQVIELVVTGLDIWLDPRRQAREEFVEKVLIPELRKLYQ